MKALNPQKKREKLIVDDFDGMIYANSFEPNAYINFKMRDTREFRFCQKCKMMKLPRMHHCSACNACCLKYDHHCGMLMNCIGVNNYHLFFQFIFFVGVQNLFCTYLNVKYNFYLDYYKNPTAKPRYLLWMIPASLNVSLVSLGLVYYCQSMFSWYLSMASRNMHAVEETRAGQIYNRSDYWGVTKSDSNCKSKECQT